MNHAYITRTAICLPNEPIENDEIEAVLGMVSGIPSRAKKIVLKSNGIKQRYYVLSPATGNPVCTNAQLTAEAIRNLFASAEEMNSIDCLVTGTTTPDQIAPNHALMVHGELGTPPCEAVATSGICLCGMTALKYAYMAVRTGTCSKAVSTGSETVSLMLRASNFEAESCYKVEKLQERPEIGFEKDFLRWMLSDGAGAFLLEPKPCPDSDFPSLRIDWLEIISYANEFESCMYIGANKQPDGSLKGWNRFDNSSLQNESVMAIKQDVRLLNDYIVPVTFTRTLERLIVKKQLHPKDIDFFLPHISSMYFHSKIKTALVDMDFHIPDEKWFVNLSTKGNTGSASIYIMIDELLKSGRIKSGNRLLCFVPESGRFSSSFMLLTAI